MFYRVLAAVVVNALLFCGQSSAQVVFKGPSEAKPNKMTTITLEKVDGDDLKLQGFINGKPTETSDWLLMKNLDNQTVIFLMTDKEAVFTFVAAVSKGNKTFLSNHVLTVGKPSNTPEPTPTPTPTSFAEKLKAEYRKSPDNASLTKLIQILDEVAGQSYRNNGDLESVLAATGLKYLPNDELRTIRDMIGEEILVKCGENSMKRDMDKVKSILKEAATTLKGL